MKPRLNPRTMRRAFANGLVTGLRVIWPVLSGLVALIVALGLTIGLIEGWSIHESIYFAFVSGLTIGYGDFAPKTLVTRALTLVIGVCGVLLTAMLAAVAVRAFTVASGDVDREDEV